MIKVIWSNPTKQRSIIPKFSIRRTFEIEDQAQYKIKSPGSEEFTLDLYRKGYRP